MLALYDSNFTECGYINKINEGGATKDLYDEELLVRAKRGLHSLSFFGLSDNLELSFQLFEKMFNDKIHFMSDKKNTGRRQLSEYAMRDMDSATIERIKQLNRLDMQLYAYAKKLFFERTQIYNIK
jgi:heparan sulfate 6-O-sulfotransferase HS6ST1